MMPASEQEAKEDANFWGNVATGLLIAGAVVGTVAIVVASGGTALAVLGTDAAIGATAGGVGGAVSGGITGGPQGAVSGFLMGAGLGALGGIAAVGAPLLFGAATAFGVVSWGYHGKAFYHNPSKENGLVLVGAVAGIIAGGLTGLGLSRLGRPASRTPQEEGGFFGGKGRQPNPNFGDTVGKYSGRDYYRGKCGGPIKSLSWKEAKISKEGIATVKRHVSRFEKTEANTKMLERLDKIERGEIEPTDYDKRYYTHEIREYERFGEMGIPDNKRGTYEDWNNAHSATLEDFKINEREQPIYHPDADID